MSKAVPLVQNALTQGNNVDLAMPLVTKPALTINGQDYQYTPEGFSALVNDVARAEGGISISVTLVGGMGWSASANGDAQMESASTYKIYVAYAVLKQIEGGQMQWGDGISGQTVASCFDAMIVRSDNTCAHALGDRVGWQTVQDEVNGYGLTHTVLQSDNHQTSANDLTLFLTKLQSGNILSSDSLNRLFGDMKKQIYRQGIPAGASGIVADKVGFVDSYIHDAGIVYDGHATYVISIMTNNSSWDVIADATREIDTFLNR